MKTRQTPPTFKTPFKSEKKIPPNQKQRHLAYKSKGPNTLLPASAPAPAPAPAPAAIVRRLF